MSDPMDKTVLLAELKGLRAKLEDVQREHKALEENYAAFRAQSDERIAALQAIIAELRAALKPLARPVPWFPDGKEDDVYLGTQIAGLDNDVTPSVGECRRAAELLARTGGPAQVRPAAVPTPQGEG